MKSTYSSTQATNCAVCGAHKHTPLRVDRMGGYVCLTCIDEELHESKLKTDDEIVAKIEELKNSLKDRRMAVYKNCAAIARDIFRENDIELEIGVEDKYGSGLYKLCCMINGRSIELILVYHSDKNVKSFPMYIGTGDEGSNCKDEKAIKRALKKYIGHKAFIKTIRDEIENKNVVGYSNGTPVYSHELGK